LLFNSKTEFLKLKKNILILVISFSIQISVFSQTQIGFKLGYNYFQIFNNFSEVSNNQESLLKTNYSSYITGMSVKDNAIKKQAFEFELTYLSNKFNLIKTIYTNDSDVIFDLNYNMGHLLFTFSDEFAFGKKNKFIINPGIYYYRLINRKVSGSRMVKYGANQNYNDTSFVDKDDELNEDGFGLCAGISFETPLYKNISLLIENNYSLELGRSSSLWKNTNGFFYVSFQIGFRYMFDKSIINPNNNDI
jgi:hypothetical protein